MRNFTLFGNLILLLMGLILVSACQCGTNADEDSGGDNDHSVSDDSGDGIDDASPSDDTDNDDADDTVIADDTAAGCEADEIHRDIEYERLACEWHDPEGLGQGVLLGSALSEGQIVVYVFDDADCEPIAGATIFETASSQRVYTNADGRAVLTPAGPPKLVTAFAPGYESWSYGFDRSVMYFRLRPKNYPGRVHDSEEGRFRFNGTDLDLDNPQRALDAFTMPAYGGVITPGISRSTIMSTDFQSVHASEEFRIDWVYDFIPQDDYPYYLPVNFYVPDIEVILEIPGITNWGFWCDNETYKIPVPDVDWLGPVGALIFSIDMSSIMEFGTLMTVFIDLLYGGSFESILPVFAKPILNGGLSFPYMMIDPEWSEREGADLELTRIGDSLRPISVSVEEPDTEFDYVSFLLAEVPNRALVPQSVDSTNSRGKALLDCADIPDADYIVLTVKSDVMRPGSAGEHISILSRFAQDLCEWEGGVNFQDKAFPAFFDPNRTDYSDNTGRLVWEMEPADELQDTIDLYWVLMLGSDYGEPVIIQGLFPPDAREAVFPLDEMGILPQTFWYDTILLVALSLPPGQEQGFDPTRLLSYDSSSMTIWTYPKPIELLMNVLFDQL